RRGGARETAVSGPPRQNDGGALPRQKVARRTSSLHDRPRNGQGNGQGDGREHETTGEVGKDPDSPTRWRLLELRGQVLARGSYLRGPRGFVVDLDRLKLVGLVRSNLQDLRGQLEASRAAHHVDEKVCGHDPFD